MSLGNWEILASSQLNASLQFTSPIDGNGSLQFTSRILSSTNQSISATLDNATDPTRGHARGRIRTLIKNVTGSGSTTIRGGIFCLAESTNWGIGTDEAYVATINSGNGNLEFNFATTTSPTGNSIGTYALGYTLGTTVALELEWHSSAVEIGGTYFVVRTGTATDFSDLTDRITIVENIPSVFNGYEGVCMIRDTTLDASFFFDKTSVFSIT